MTTQARGTFDVKLNKVPGHDSKDGSPLARMSINKKFNGDLDATSIGEMLAAGTSVKGSAGYVAMERVTGTLNGRVGEFVFQHSATMNRGAPTLSVSVVPDSGTGQLVGLAGTLNIIIANGQHSYEFDYAVPAADSPLP